MDSKHFLFLFLLFFISFVTSDCDKIIYPTCNYSTSCKCPKLPQGQYCGSQLGCNPCNIFECNLTGGTCEYGYSIACSKCGAKNCSIITSATPIATLPGNSFTTPSLKPSDYPNNPTISVNPLIITIIITCIATGLFGLLIYRRCAIQEKGEWAY
ncbi:28876_t:CDS:2 [Dentiscutata erythropus]|uniref:28876_t:CDS:1 n=1 Tax=Dentiscutata erythropus TaxID=1348616 RepID=A0A9N9GQB3_9GLOM|nr:28876_t:CDS:2 [Dentiscutata erythropus]